MSTLVIPAPVKKLVRMISRGVMTLPHAIVLDYILAYPCIKEDDLCSLLKLDKKLVRMNIDALKKEKFIKVKLRVETDEDGRATRHNYYYVDVKSVVNLVKYKVHQMQQSIEGEERRSRQMALFRCGVCQKSYTELEADRLYDILANVFRCPICETEVEEERAVEQEEDARSLMERFNLHFAPIYELLKEIDGIDIDPELCNPEPILDFEAAKQNKKRDRAEANGKGGPYPSGAVMASCTALRRPK